MTASTTTNTQNTLELHALNLSRSLDKQLTAIQENALDLYQRGFNVFPLPRGSKKPFINTPLRQLYTSRLHLCGDGVGSCSHRASVPAFIDLFGGRKNIAVMCGKTSGNLLAVDCDTLEAYERIGEELDARDLPYWTFSSHRGGCYLLRVAEGETSNVAKSSSQFENVELWGNCHYVVLPPSVHPAGTIYQWRGNTEPRFHFAAAYETLPTIRVKVLDWLGVTLVKPEASQGKKLELYGLSAKYEVLSRRNRKTLARGANEGERNTLLSHLAYDLAGCGLDRDDIEPDFLLAAQLCEPSYPQHHALAILKSAYAKGRTPSRKYAATQKSKVEIQQLRAFANSFDWKGQFGRKARTRKLVFSACINRSEKEGPVFRASVRELAECTNHSYQFVNVCVHDLLHAGLLRLVTSAKKSMSGANVFAFGETVKLPPIDDSITTTCNTNVINWRYEKMTQTDAWKDVFRRLGLGVVAGQVLCCLLAGPYRSKYAIAKAIGAAFNSVSRAVGRLVEHGLVIYSQSEGLYYADPVKNSQLLMLSIKMGTNGRAELQRIRHRIEREIFINYKLSKAMSV